MERNTEKVEPRMLSVRAAARYLGCSDTQVTKLLAQDKLPAVRYTDKAAAKRYIPLDALEQFLNDRLRAERVRLDPHARAAQFKAVVRRATAKVKLER